MSLCIKVWGQWDQFLPLAEFAYKKNYHSSIQIAIFVALYSRGFRTPIDWFESSKPRPNTIDVLQEAFTRLGLFIIG